MTDKDRSQNGGSRSRRPISESLKEYGRGLAGGLMFSLPLLYTMEVWWTGFIADPLRLIIYVLVTIVLVFGYNYYAGFRKDVRTRDVLFDSIEATGLGLVASAAVLWLLGRITPDMSRDEIIGKIVIEMMLVAIGISVGTKQLGGGGPQQGQEAQKTHTSFGHQLVMGFCGAILFAANVAPTEEIVMIGVETDLWKLLLLSLASIGIGTGILYYADFTGAQRSVRPVRGMRDILIGSVVMYGVALTASALMLWFFGRFDGASPVVIVSETVVLAFPGALGASAGRLLIGS